MNGITVWRVCKVLVCCLIVITFTPLVTPTNRSSPTFLHLPYTLWVGILLSVVLVMLTYLGSRFHPGLAQDQPGENSDDG
ncbi:MAG: hypothetical protein OEQ53_18130 [Saprospiraceae bacterium]|nr:hypothetical protein [Saprospiraceae bacterium]